MPDEEITEIMNDYDIDEDEAEEVQEIMQELGVDLDEAIEIQESS